MILNIVAVTPNAREPLSGSGVHSGCRQLSAAKRRLQSHVGETPRRIELFGKVEQQARGTGDITQGIRASANMDLLMGSSLGFLTACSWRPAGYGPDQQAGCDAVLDLRFDPKRLIDRADQLDC